MTVADAPGSPLARATIAVPVALLLFVLLHGALGIGRDTTPRIHSLRNPAGCSECHLATDLTALAAAEPALCLRCHAELGPACEPPAESGGPACTACHDPHGKEDRRPRPPGAVLDGTNSQR